MSDKITPNEARVRDLLTHGLLSPPPAPSADPDPRPPAFRAAVREAIERKAAEYGRM